ncbi:MAG: molybdopterin-dependent oxidoreductase [Desulfobacterales bacterium]|nr:MAG: molybdopterin-dependent oxidoreductase [Desulfobacterales bacterium]
MESKSKISLKIDGGEVTADEGMTILEVAQQAGIHIPTLCHHPALSKWGGCRMCVVEVEGVPRLVASCVMPVREGMMVVTTNERIIKSRRAVLEFIFAERNHNCMFCEKSGDCELQQLAYDLQMDHMAVPQAFTPYPLDITNDYMGIDHNRCILCGRCVRACAELAGNHVLAFQNRGPRSLIGFDLNETLNGSTCYACGICLQVCPTGAIFNRQRTHYAVKGHTKAWQATDSHCPQCGLLCATTMVVADNTLLKVEGRLTADGKRPDRGQLCFRGRFEIFNDFGERLRHPLVRNAKGRWTEESWENALDRVAKKMNSLRDTAGGQVLFGIASGGVSNEVLIAFRDLLAKGWSAGTIDTFDGSHYRAVLAASRELGHPLEEASWRQLPDSDFVIACGADLSKRQPLLLSLLRRNVLENGSRVAVIGPADVMASFRSFYFETDHEDLPAWVDILWNMAAQASGGTPKAKGKTQKTGQAGGKRYLTDLQKKVGMPAKTRTALTDMVSQYLASKQPLVIAGEALSDAKCASALNHLARLTGLKDPDACGRLMILKRDGNSAGAWKLGIAAQKRPGPKRRLKAGLMLLGEESAADIAVWTGRSAPEFLAVISPHMPTKLLDKAQVFIPRPSWLEEEGTYTASDGNETAHVKKVLTAPEGVRDTWQTLLALADRTGGAPALKTLEQLTKKAAAELNPGIET